MARAIRLLLISAALFTLFGNLRAEGLVQLTLKGEVQTRGGAPVEIRWTSKSSTTGKFEEVGLRLHLAEGTSAFDVATLLVGRLREAGAKVRFPGEKARQVHRVQVFVEATTQISLRLAPGMASTITTCDAAPTSVRFLSPLSHVARAMMMVQTTTFHPHSKKPGSILLEMGLDALRPPAEICESIFQQTLELGLVSERPTTSSWRPIKGADGAAVTGCSIELNSVNSDWGLEVSLEVPAGE